MSVIFIVLPLALLVVLAAVIAYLWAARRGQFDDLTTPAIRALHDDEPSRERAGDADPAPGEPTDVAASTAPARRGSPATGSRPDAPSSRRPR